MEIKMSAIISEYIEKSQIITPDDNYHYFFGYYDMRATVGDKPHLCHRVRFMDRLPDENDVCEVGYLVDRKFIKIGETTAWNFQQGAMLQYHPYLEDTVYYNVFEDGKFQTVTHNFATGEKKYADRATACISPDGKWGLGVNFGRIFAFRPGYGYAGFVDEFADVNAPHNDGVFLVDMENGTSRQINHYDDLAKISGFNDDDKVLVNHITFNTTSDRFVMLVRNFPAPGKWWSTSMVIGDLEGNAHAVLLNTYVSHYFWVDGSHILAHCTVGTRKSSMFIIDVDSGEAVEYRLPYFSQVINGDIHCNLSPDGNFIIGDGYDFGGYRSLQGYSMKTGVARELLKAKTMPPACTDIRCDLHAQFVWGGKYISYDTTENGKREIALIPTDILDF